MNSKILIVDDNINVRATLIDIFTELGNTVVEAVSGEEALDKLQFEKPALVLVDTRLPGMNGFEVCRQIRKEADLNTKIIVYTGRIDAIDAVKARRMGADDYCVKGFDPALLIDAAQKLV
jgi:DNA-binding response OmpR family regulator